MRPLTPRHLVAAMLLVASLPLTNLAHAADPSDIVTLANGGRLRGTVIEHDPSKVTTIRLLDGSTRTLKPREVARVEYAEVTASAPAAITAPLPPPAPPAAPAPAATPATTTSPATAHVTSATLPADADERPAHPGAKRMKSKPLFVTGIIMVGVGAVAVIGGAAYFAANSGTKTSGYQSCGDLGCTNQHEDYKDSTDTTVGAGVAVAGGVVAVTGLVLMLVGVHRVPVDRDAETASLPTVTPSFGHRTGGLTVRF